MKKQARTDIISSAVAILFGVFVYAMSGSIVIKRKGGDIGSAFLPRLVAGIMIGLGVLLLISTLIKMRRQPASAEAAEKKAGNAEWLPTLLSFVNLIVYVLIFKPVGFLISTFIYLMAQMLIMSPVKKPDAKRLALWAMIALIAALAIFFLFTKAFSMPLPKGILG
ncbi:MAG: tripartite tricarboxylate transporter TctB family protein [Clostridia bacterium]|nr:tripartite tricarboxylate transporter TctB family protein [Clostridia bacterium]